MGLLSTKKSLTLAAAKEIGAAAEAEARKNNFTNCVAIFDDGGNLLYLVTMDGTQTGSINVAQQKGLAALRFKRSTKAVSGHGDRRQAAHGVSARRRAGGRRAAARRRAAS